MSAVMCLAWESTAPKPNASQEVPCTCINIITLDWIKKHTRFKQQYNNCEPSISEHVNIE